MTKQKKQDAAAEEAAEQAAAPANKPWMADDYTGPLTADQAAWRNANIKPVVEDTKPAGEVVTK